MNYQIRLIVGSFLLVGSFCDLLVTSRPTDGSLLNAFLSFFCLRFFFFVAALLLNKTFFFWCGGSND